MEQTTKGEKFLKVTGIFMIIGGALSLILSIIAIIGIAALVYVSSGEISSGLLYASGILMLVGSLAELIAGIIGVKNCRKPEKAVVCIGWGIAVAALSIVSMILNSVGGGDFSATSLVTSLALPILYIIGAFRNRQG